MVMPSKCPFCEEMVGDADLPHICGQGSEIDSLWYKEYIEENIRGVVKLLRDNGFNTECSCGHRMYVQCQYISDGEIMRLDYLLYNHGYRNYEIKMILTRMNGYLDSTINIQFEETENGNV